MSNLIAITILTLIMVGYCCSPNLAIFAKSTMFNSDIYEYTSGGDRAKLGRTLCLIRFHFVCIIAIKHGFYNNIIYKNNQYENSVRTYMIINFTLIVYLQQKDIKPNHICSLTLISFSIHHDSYSEFLENFFKFLKPIFHYQI